MQLGVDPATLELLIGEPGEITGGVGGVSLQKPGIYAVQTTLNAIYLQVGAISTYRFQFSMLQNVGDDRVVNLGAYLRPLNPRTSQALER